jgi:hypothetical protein
MRIAAGEGVRADLVHHGSRNDLETDWERVEAESGRGNIPNLLNRRFKILDFFVDHFLICNLRSEV